MKVHRLDERISFSRGKPSPELLFDGGSFQASLICLKAGTEIPPHPEDYGVFLLVTEGSGTFTDSNGESELKRNQGIFIKRGETRGIRASEDLVILGIRDNAKGGREDEHS